MRIFIDSLQLMGGILLAIGYIPQIIKIIRTKSVGGFSPLWLFMLFFGISLMEVYAIYNLPTTTMFLITNSISLCLSFTVLFLYIILHNKEAEQDIESLKKNPLTSLTKSELKYYIDLLKGFIKYIEPKETNGGVMEAIDGIKEFISRISKEG